MNEEYISIRPYFGLEPNQHFTEDLYIRAVEGMENEDGTKGPHYKVEEVEELLSKRKDFSLGENNIYDYAYVLNMVYSDYYGAVKDDDKAYLELADKFIFDKDGPKGKALLYWQAMHY